MSSEFDNWNPMAEDYSSPKFNSYNSASEVDDCSLYIKNIPISLSKEAFIALMSENGRKVIRSKLFDPREGHDTTIGLVTFEGAKDAAEVMQKMNKKPPLNMFITYANKKPPRKFDRHDDASSSYSHSHRAPTPVSENSKTQNSKSTSTNAVPSLGGKGRGNLINSLKFPTLRIVLDGDKRTSFAPNQQNGPSSQTPSSNLPKLVENPFLKCLACDNVGKFSCSACKKPYCSSSCQVEDWPKHKMSCTSKDKRSRDSSYVSESSGSDSEKKYSSPPKSSAVEVNKQPQPVNKESQAVNKQPQVVNKQPQAVNKKHQLPEAVKVKDIQTYDLPKTKQLRVRVSHTVNPSKFWVQPPTAQDLLSQMERDLALSSKQTPTSHDPSYVYCINKHKVCKRVAIQEMKGGKTALVQFLDYGNTDTVQLDQLFLMPAVFKNIQFQAVCCKLSDTGNEAEVAWSEDDTLSFQTLTSDNQIYSAILLKKLGDISEVNLSTDEGISLYSIITTNLKLSSEVEERSDSSKSKTEQPPSTIPTVLSNLKSGAEVFIKAMEFSEDQLWGLLLDGETDKEIQDLESLLNSLNSKDYSLCAEEGDVVAGFSLNYQQFYRCVVLKRLRDRFLVHFIDYGNKEEISKLSELTPELKGMCCHLVCCTKPDSLSPDAFKTAFSEIMQVTVNRSEHNSAKLSFSHQNGEKFMDCFPWYHGVLQEKRNETPVKQAPRCSPSQICDTKSTPAVSEQKEPPIRLQNSSPRPVVSQDKKRITGDLVPDLPVAEGDNYCIRVIIIASASKIYVQLIKLDAKLQALCLQLNEYGKKSASQKNYSPIKNEIVCCKFKEDGNWYRGQVVGKRGNEYKVFFVDYGNEDTVTSEEMIPLPENLSSHKFALCASLQGLSNEDIKDFIPNLVKDSWDMKVVNKSSVPVQVMLYQKDKPLTDLIKKIPSLPCQKLLGTKCKVMVSHLERDVAWVQQESDAKKIEDLVQRINAGVAKLSTPKEISVGGVYCALFNDDGLWYRASVNGELPANHYLVTFVDFGNQATVDCKNLKELPEEFFKFPNLCVPVVPTNKNISQMQLQVWYSIEVTGEKSGAQLVKILNAPKKVVSLSSLKKTELEDGVTEVTIGYSNGDIHYCLPLSGREELMALVEQLAECPKEELNSGDLSVGSVVCAKTDGVWLRGAVSKILSGASYEIFFIDSGYSETVCLENIKILPEFSLRFPIFAVPCRITNLSAAKRLKDSKKPLPLKTVCKAEDGIPSVEVVVPNLLCGVEVFSLEKRLLPLKETTQVFLTYVEGDVCYCQMVCDRDRIKSLELKLKTASDYESLDDLPEPGYVVCAKFIDNVWYRGSVEEVYQSTKSCKICFIDYGNTEIITVENLKILPSEISELPIFSIPIKITNIEKLQEFSSEDGTFPVQAIEVSADGVQIVEIADPGTPNPIFTLIDSQFLSDSASEVIVCHEEGGLYYVNKVSDAESLGHVMLTLQSPENQQALKHKPQVGEILCAKYSDNNWYRGMIKEDCGHDMLKVFFIDYGNTEVINITDLCYLPPSCASLPMFSIPIKLSNQKAVRLSLNSTYMVKCISRQANNIQIVKVRPSVEPVSIAALKASRLEEDLALVTFQSSCDGSFFLTKSSEVDQINEMKKLLRDFEGEEIFDTPIVDEVFIVKGADKKWHRSCIKATDVKPGFCRVFLIDEGTTEDISYSDICYVSDELISFPIFSINVLLNSDTKTDIQFGKECVAHVLIKASIPTVQIITLYMLDSLGKHHLPVQTSKQIMFCHRDGEILFLQEVDQQLQLLEVVKEVKACSLAVIHKAKVGELLVAQSSIDSEWYRCCIEEVVSCDKYKVNFIDYGNSEVVHQEKLRYFNHNLFEHPPLSVGVKVTTPSASVEFYQVYTVIADNLPPASEPQLVKLILETPIQEVQTKEEVPDAARVPKIYTYDDSNFVPFPEGEQHIIIWAEITGNGVFGAPYNPKNIEDSIKLTSEITEYVSSLAEVSSYEGEPPQENEMVLALYEGEWYRAVVTDTEQSAPNYDVLFVDWGNKATLPITLLRRMQKQFLTLNMQVHFFQLTGFQFSESDSAAITEEIKSNFVQKPLTGVVTSVGQPAEIFVQIDEITEHLKKKNLVSS